jgi:sulfate adenylyltransferase subunit 1
LEAVEASSSKKGYDYLDLSMITDGLRAEREQGITIDVAYRYFSTKKRKFIIADTPGHIQYTRNMVTGASTANMALILVDARKGLVEQTRRHSFLASLLKIPHIVLVINKMDLVNFDESVYYRIVEDYKAFSSKLEVHDIQYVPVSALLGDNIVDRSPNMDWYKGATLLHIIEQVPVESDFNHIDPRFPVQHVLRPHTHEHQDFRGYLGRVAGGIFRKGDEVVVWPSGQRTSIKEIFMGSRPCEEAFAPMSVTMTLTSDIDVGRGDLIAKPNNQPESSQDINMMLCWMGPRKAAVGGRYVVKHTTREALCVLKEITYKLNINTLQRQEGEVNLEMNDIARVRIRTSRPLAYDSYRKNRLTGSLILIDEATNETVAAGMIL